jgi:hypothetical protein
MYNPLEALRPCMVFLSTHDHTLIKCLNTHTETHTKGSHQVTPSYHHLSYITGTTHTTHTHQLKIIIINHRNNPYTHQLKINTCHQVTPSYHHLSYITGTTH